MTVTDELLAELDLSVRAVWHDDDAAVIAVDALTAELRRLRADNAELEQSLAESRANDRASMAWLSAYRVAARGGDMPLPEMVSHIEGLAKDAGWYRWIAKRSEYGIDCRQRPALTLPIYAPDHIDRLGDAIDTAMATQ